MSYNIRKSLPQLDGGELPWTRTCSFASSLFLRREAKRIPKRQTRRFPRKLPVLLQILFMPLILTPWHELFHSLLRVAHNRWADLVAIINVIYSSAPLPESLSAILTLRWLSMCTEYIEASQHLPRTVFQNPHMRKLIEWVSMQFFIHDHELINDLITESLVLRQRHARLWLCPSLCAV